MSALVIWDGFGLDNSHSGIGQHGASIHRRLRGLGVDPLIASPSLLPFSESFQILTPRLPLRKLLWVKGQESYLEQFVFNDQELVTHGLSNFNCFGIRRSRRILTIHDLIPLLKPSVVSKALHYQMNYLIPKAVSYADKVICVSKWTKDQCEGRFPEFRDKFIYIPNGRSEKFSNVSRGTMSKRLLTVSRFEPYKGFEIVVSTLKNLPKNICLDLVTDSNGSKWAKENAKALIESQRLKVHVGVSKDKLDSLMDSSSLLFHGSSLEGFCLPAVEMLSRGKPIVYRSGSGIDEVVGMGGIGIESNHLPDYADAIVSILENFEEWLEKVDVQRRGGLSWSEVAKRTLSVYND